MQKYVYTLWNKEKLIIAAAAAAVNTYKRDVEN